MASVTSETSSAQTPVPWEMPAPEPADSVFKEKVAVVLQGFKASVLEAHGGPVQYLQTQLSDPADAEQFGLWLWNEFPLRGDRVYNLAAPLPSVEMNKRGDSLPCKVHIAMLGFSTACSIKPPPSAHTSLELAEHLLNEGFLTSEKPLLVKHLDPQDLLSLESPWKTEANGMPIAPFGLGFVKGMLRASTALALLHMFWADSESAALLATFPAFRETLGTVYCHHVVLSSLETEMVQNFLLSFRDSLSKPPNFLTWLHTLAKLKQCGYDDSAAVIARFNQQVPQKRALIGSKAAALGNVLNLFPDTLIQTLQKHASQYSWEGCCLSDDALSSKKILPGYSFKSLCPHKSWKKRSVMTIEATTWCFNRLLRDFEKPGAVRKKASKEKVESTAESACLLWHLTMELQGQFPISKEAVVEHILDPWADGSHGWDLELHELLAEKREKLAVTDSKMFRNVVDICNCKAPLGPTPNTELLVSKLDDDKWSLVCKQLDYDIQCFRVYLSKLHSHSIHIHHCKLDWNRKRREESQQWLQQWLKQRCRVFAYDPQEQGAINRAVAENVLELVKANGVEKSALVPLKNILVLLCLLF